MATDRPVFSAAPPDGGLCFALERWCLWQPDAGGGGSPWPRGTAPADLGLLPLMQRRRLSPLARAAIAAAWPCRPDQGEMPAVFCSNHGESHYYFEMLDGYARAGETSPSRFGLAVHNAVAGLYSALTGAGTPYLALAPGEEGPSAALLEAAGWLAGNPRRPVLVVCYEQPLPDPYRRYADSPDATLALALRLGAAAPDGPALRLRRVPAGPPAAPECRLQRLCRAVLNGERRFTLAGERAAWQWSLDDA
jgi:hypothetical protein